MTGRVPFKAAVLAAGATVVLAGAGILGWFVFWQAEPEPVVDKELEHAVRPVIDSHLRQGPWTGLLTTARPDTQPRWFCAEHVIEIRAEGSQVKVGLTALCDEYGRSGDVLLSGSGEHVPKLITLTGGPDRYQVVRVEQPKDGAGYAESVKRLFTPAGLAEVQRRVGGLAQPDAETLKLEAKRAFGLPADAPVMTHP